MNESNCLSEHGERLLCATMSDINTEAVSSNQAGIHLAAIQLTESDIGPRGSLPSSLEEQNTFLDLRRALSADCHHKNVENILDGGA